MPIHVDAATPIEELFRLGVRDCAWTLDTEAPARVESAYQRLGQQLKQSMPSIYGLHTHYGHNVSQSVSAENWQEHQEALLLYLQVGTGPFLPESVVRRALRLQAYKMSLGYSAIHPKTWSDLLDLGQALALPNVPCYGSLGASGDLVPMAHAVAPLFRQSAPRGPRDVISLVNTNAMMASLAIEQWQRAWQCYRESHGIWMLAAQALGWPRAGLLREGLEARSSRRPFRAPWLAAVEALQESLARHQGADCPVASVPLQERYSIRCAPQILLDIGENLQVAAHKIEEEALGVADNPLILESGPFHGGHFFASGLATAADLIQDALARIAELVDRQMLLLVTPELNHGLPANLALHPRDHLKGLHQLASALLQSIRAQAMPARMLSFSCESHNQDVVPASMTALLQADKVGSLTAEMMRIGSFISERAFRLRYNLSLPEALALKHWSEFQSSTTWQRLELALPFAQSSR